jgi:hypothetical protein
LETEFLRAYGGYSYFKSWAEGFSLFAVIGQKKAPVVVPPPTVPGVIPVVRPPPLTLMLLLLIGAGVSIGTFVTLQIMKWTKRRALKPAPVTLVRPKVKKVKPKKPPPVIEIYRDLLGPAAEELAKKKEEEARKKERDASGKKRGSGSE